MRLRAWSWVALQFLLWAHGVSAETGLRVGVARDRRVIVVDCAAAAMVAGSAIHTCGAKESAVLWPGPRREHYRVQVAALRDDAEARALAARLAPWGPARLLRESETAIVRVQSGAFLSREEAMAARGAIARAGVGKGFLVGESGETVRVTRTGSDAVVTVASPVVFRPAAGETVIVDGTRYRGEVEVQSLAGNLTAINALDLEEYLRGVVPKEMGPSIYPELQALKAQAVAARSWVVANLDRHAKDGFDVCAGAHCQVYGGVDAVAELTDRAVSETRGVVLMAADRVLESFFSATCGGHTENVENVFLGSAAEPWLSGVPCAFAGPALALPRGQPIAGSRAEDGRAAGGPAAILFAAGVLEPLPGDDDLVRPVSRAVASRWTAAAARRAGSPGRGDEWSADTGSLTLRDLALLLAGGFALAERGQVLVGAADLEVLVRDCGEADPGEQRAVATLTLLDAWPRLTSGRCDLSRTVSLGQFLVSLHRILVALEVPLLEEGVAVALEAGTLVVRRGDFVTRLAITPNTLLLRELRGDFVALGGGLVRPGDGIRYRTGDGVARVVVVLDTVSGGDDRRARDSRWSVTLTRAQLEARLLRLGTLRELRVTSRGVSGRVRELYAGFDRGHQRIEGYAVKTTLGLKDDLVVIEPIAGAAAGDPPAAFRFAGRGWGHGVGLCQEGAFGMALRGETHEAILGHYFAGAKLGSLDEIGGAAPSR